MSPRADRRSSPRRAIATANEGPLHAGLKEWYRRPGDRLEVPVDGRQIDVVRGDLLVEIQTSGFSALKAKLRRLTEDHPVRLVYPVAHETWIVRTEAGEVLGRRKSPRRGRVEQAFAELVSLPRLLLRETFSLEVLLIQAEEVRRREPGRWRRKGWVIVERRLLDVKARHLIEDLSDLTRFLPDDLPNPFTTADVARGLGISRDLAQKMAYCLRETGAIRCEGRKRAGYLYARV